MNKYYSMEKEGDDVNVYVFGDIVSDKWYENDVTAFDLAKDLSDANAKNINVFINSYGGETAVGLAIYNVLKRNEATVTTYCDGFACSAASVIFMAGDKRVMNNASLLMIHNAWSWAVGNAEDMKKASADLEIISKTTAETYMEKVSIERSELDELLANESWINPEDAVSWGFATEIAQASKDKPQSSIKSAVMQKMLAKEPPQNPSQSTEIDNGKILQGLLEKFNPDEIASKLKESFEIKEKTPTQTQTESVFNLMRK